MGTNARNALEKEASEYYLIYRYLKFEKLRIELRNSILDTLNAGLELAGKQIESNTRILITGLPTLDDVQTAYNHLLQGDIPFAEVMERFQGYQTKMASYNYLILLWLTGILHSIMHKTSDCWAPVAHFANISANGLCSTGRDWIALLGTKGV